MAAASATPAASFLTGNRSARGGTGQQPAAGGEHAAGDQDHVQAGHREDVGEARDLHRAPGRLVDAGAHAGDQGRRHGAGGAGCCSAIRSAISARSSAIASPSRRPSAGQRCAGPIAKPIAPSRSNQAWRAKSNPPGRVGASGRCSRARSRTRSPGTRSGGRPPQVDPDGGRRVLGGHAGQRHPVEQHPVAARQRREVDHPALDAIDAVARRGSGPRPGAGAAAPARSRGRERRGPAAASQAARPRQPRIGRGRAACRRSTLQASRAQAAARPAGRRTPRYRPRAAPAATAASGGARLQLAAQRRRHGDRRGGSPRADAQRRSPAFAAPHATMLNDRPI